MMQGTVYQFITQLPEWSSGYTPATGTGEASRYAQLYVLRYVPGYARRAFRVCVIATTVVALVM